MTPIKYLNVSARARRVIERAGFHFIEDIEKNFENGLNNLMNIPKCGPTTTLEIIGAVTVFRQTTPLDVKVRLTKLEEFAKEAMGNIFSGPGARMVADRDERYDETNWKEVVALNAFEMAEEMLKEAEKRQS